jgi:hypothetical protein
MKRKVTDLLPNEAILISNDAERDAILQLMEDAGYIWANRDKPTQWMPMFPYPIGIELEDFILFNNESYLYEQMGYAIYPATDFIGSEGEMERGITIVKQNGEVISAETIATLRAEKAELIEALRGIVTQWDTPNWKLTESTGTIINQARQTLAKYETK